MAARRRRGPGPGLGALLVSVLAVLGPALRGARAALDLQELGELKYGLEILAEPVLAGQRPPGDVVTVASKFKQRYECRLPAAAVRSPPDPLEEAQLYNGSGVTELLQPMGTAPCLVKVGVGELLWVPAASPHLFPAGGGAVSEGGWWPGGR
uniref:Endoplasmic reticulum lectin n=1 Tax=Strigops habroptila TaxID=2489341 RepID=A0A672VCS6_STRHB